MATFEQMPAALERMQAKIEELFGEVKKLNTQQPINEPPIDGKELRKRLGISVPTEIKMRKRKELPYLNMCGQYRYVWHDVIKALQNKK